MFAAEVQNNNIILNLVFTYCVLFQNNGKKYVHVLVFRIWSLEKYTLTSLNSISLFILSVLLVDNYHLTDIFRFVRPPCGVQYRFEIHYDIPEFCEILCCWSIIAPNIFSIYILSFVWKFTFSFFEKKRTSCWKFVVHYPSGILFQTFVLNKEFSSSFFFMICNSPFMKWVWAL